MPEEKDCIKCGNKFWANELCEVKITKEGLEYYDYFYEEVCDDCKEYEGELKNQFKLDN